MCLKHSRPKTQSDANNRESKVRSFPQWTTLSLPADALPMVGAKVRGQRSVLWLTGCHDQEIEQQNPDNNTHNNQQAYRVRLPRAHTHTHTLHIFIQTQSLYCTYWVSLGFWRQKLHIFLHFSLLSVFTGHLNSPLKRNNNMMKKKRKEK